MSLHCDGPQAIALVPPPVQASCLCGKTKHSYGVSCVQCAARLSECCMDRQQAAKCARCFDPFCASHLTTVDEDDRRLYCQNCAGVVMDEASEAAAAAARAEETAVRRVLAVERRRNAGLTVRPYHEVFAAMLAGKPADEAYGFSLAETEKLPTVSEMYREAYGAAAGKRGA